MSITISSPNMEDTETLYGKYIEIPGNEGAGLDDFYEFLSVESAGRQLFLEEYCTYEFVEAGNTVVLKYSVKV